MNLIADTFIREGYISSESRSKAVVTISNITPDASAVCPKCKNASIMNNGSFISLSASVPLKVKWSFLNFTLNLTVRVKYCYKCGYFNIVVKQE